MFAEDEYRHVYPHRQQRRLDLGNNSGVYSTLRINGVLGNQGYPFTADTSGITLPVTSTLGVTGTVKAGDYSGQSVAILALP